MFVHPDQRRHMLDVIARRVILVMPVHCCSIDHTRNPPRRFGLHAGGRPAVPQGWLIGPALRCQQVPGVEHQPVILRVPSLEHTSGHESMNPLNHVTGQTGFPAADQQHRGQNLKRPTRPFLVETGCRLIQIPPDRIDHHVIRRHTGLQGCLDGPHRLDRLARYGLDQFPRTTVDLRIVCLLIHGQSLSGAKI